MPLNPREKPDACGYKTYNRVFSNMHQWKKEKNKIIQKRKKSDKKPQGGASRETVTEMGGGREAAAEKRAKEIANKLFFPVINLSLVGQWQGPSLTWSE